MLLVAGCGGKSHGAVPVVGSSHPLAEASPARDGGSEVEAAVVTLDELASRGTRLAPGMRELYRGTEGALVSFPADKDTCVRVAFAATRPVVASLAGPDGAKLAEVAPTKDGVIGSRGPVCYRAGRTPMLRFEGADGGVRYVAWGAP